jgi:hypothetical protein
MLTRQTQDGINFSNTAVEDLRMKKDKYLKSKAELMLKIDTLSKLERLTMSNRLGKSFTLIKLNLYQPLDTAKIGDFTSIDHSISKQHCQVVDMLILLVIM